MQQRSNASRITTGASFFLKELLTDDLVVGHSCSCIIVLLSSCLCIIFFLPAALAWVSGRRRW
jgi:hypothetical protein